ncbi:MAG: ATPase, T2SS/T4P/T4SS family [bacterium]|nr:ATPase, T2SS/T4P/T4SS family [bacterium]
MPVPKRERIGDMLVKAKIIEEEQLQKALEVQKKTNKRLGRILIDLGFVGESVIIDFLGSQLGIPYINLGKIKKIDPEVLRSVPEFIARRHLLIPISKEGNTITIAMADPVDILAIDDIKFLIGECDVNPVVASEREVTAAIEEFYGRSKAIMEILEGAIMGEEGVETRERMSAANLITHFLSEAIKARASDIHIEPYEKELRTRYRIDGMLYEVASPPKEIQKAIVSQIKIMAHLDVTERRLPQEGGCKVRVDDREIDLQISITPTVYGEKTVMKILTPIAGSLDITRLGFEQEALALYQKCFLSSSGFILFTGPKTSGKTTTIYTTLTAINSSEKNIMTVENPIKSLLPGINQQQINLDIGLTFSRGLKSFLSQDSDVIMVGGIVDKETARLAINAALTGHLVFGIMHSNDSLEALTRLINMGIEPFLIASTVKLCITQRLARMICEECKEPYEVTYTALKDIGIKIKGKGKEKVILHRGVGCKSCNNIGYKGRTGIFEVMEINEKIQEAIVNRAPRKDIKEAAIASGMITLQESALRKVLAGIITVEELLRITL